QAGGGGGRAGEVRGGGGSGGYFAGAGELGLGPRASGRGTSSRRGRQPQRPENICTTTNAAAATAAEAGMVRTQAQRMRPATPQRTARVPLVAPTPTIAPVMVWVVETGMPSLAMARMVTPPPVSAQKPPIGCSLVRLWPMVRMIRQPPPA